MGASAKPELGFHFRQNGQRLVNPEDSKNPQQCIKRQSQGVALTGSFHPSIIVDRLPKDRDAFSLTEAKSISN